MKKKLLVSLLSLTVCFVNAGTSHLTVLNGSPVCSVVNDDDAAKILIKHSSVCIHKAQKYMIANKKTDVGGKLAQAVKLQSYAIALYNEGKQKEASCSSLEARKLAADIMKEVVNREDPYFAISAEDTELSGKCESRETLLKSSNNALKSLPNKDSDYAEPGSLNNTNVDFK